jgi:hypothetical protein
LYSLSASTLSKQWDKVYSSLVSVSFCRYMPVLVYSLN